MHPERIKERYAVHRLARELHGDLCSLRVPVVAESIVGDTFVPIIDESARKAVIPLQQFGLGLHRPHIRTAQPTVVTVVELIEPTEHALDGGTGTYPQSGYTVRLILVHGQYDGTHIRIRPHGGPVTHRIDQPLPAAEGGSRPVILRPAGHPAEDDRRKHRYFPYHSGNHKSICRLRRRSSAGQTAAAIRPLAQQASIKTQDSVFPHISVPPPHLWPAMRF